MAIWILALMLAAAALLMTGCTTGSTDDVPATVVAELTRVAEEATRTAPTPTPTPSPSPTPRPLASADVPATVMSELTRVAGEATRAAPHAIPYTPAFGTGRCAGNGDGGTDAGCRGSDADRAHTDTSAYCDADPSYCNAHADTSSYRDADPSDAHADTSPYCDARAWGNEGFQLSIKEQRHGLLGLEC